MRKFFRPMGLIDMQIFVEKTIKLGTFCFCVASAAAQNTGRLTFERWIGLPSSFSVLTLQQEGIAKRSPNFTDFSYGAECPAGQGDFCGARLRGTVVAPLTGNYTFFIAGDDSAELWLSPNASRFDKNRIAWNHVYSNIRQWDKLPTQRSNAIRLQSGQAYYLEALMQEKTGDDHLSIGWAYEAPVASSAKAIGTPVMQNWSEVKGVISLKAEGGDIWGTADRFSFYQRSWKGDGEIIARVGSMNNPQEWAKVGVMIRATLDPGSTNAAMVRTPSNGMSFQSRKAVGAASITTSISPACDWVKLEKKGQVISGFTSQDGSHWTKIGSETFIDMPQSVLVGIAASDASNSLTQPVRATVTNFEVRPITAFQVIPAAQIAPLVADQNDRDDDNLPDNWEKEYGLSVTSKYAKHGQYGDFDNDGVSNFNEYRMQSNPASKNIVIGGLTRERWESLPGSRVVDLTITHDRFLQHPEERCQVPNIDESNHGDNFGSRYRGFIIAPTSGEYRFWISGDDEAELWLADGSIQKRINGQSERLLNRYGKRRIACVQSAGLDKNQLAVREFDRYTSQRSNLVILTAGQHYYFEVLHKDSSAADHLSVAWQVPGSARAVIPPSAFIANSPEVDDLDDDNLPGAWETQTGLNPLNNGITDSRDGQYGDWDADGLTNLEEYQIGTNPKLADTDTDGTDDFTEFLTIGSDPTLNDMTSSTLVQNVSVVSGLSISGVWRQSGDGGVYSSSPYAKMEFTFNLPRNGVYLMGIEGHVGGVNLLSTETISLRVAVDGVSLANIALIQKKGMKRGASLVVLPYLRAGSHVLRLTDLNVVESRRSYIDTLQILTAGGKDSNADGIPDWTTRKTDESNLLSRFPAVSNISPLCVEGKSSHAGTTSLVTGTGIAVPVVAGPDSMWYSNLTLDEFTETVYSVAFENGVKVIDLSTRWIPTNILSGGSIVVRKGDSLKLTAHPPTTVPDKGVVAIRGLPQPLQTTADTPRIVTFPTVGVYPISALYTPTVGGANVAGTLTVRVEDGNFGGDFPVYVNRKRTWMIGSLKPENPVTFDSKLVGVDLPPGSPGRSLAVNTSALGPHHVIARTSDGGAVLARGTVVGYNIASTYGTQGVHIINTYPNGDRIVEMRVAVSELPPGSYIKLVIFAAGVTFEDGTRIKILRLKDFGKNGVAFVRFNYPAGTRTSICHRLYVCDALGNIIGER